MRKLLFALTVIFLLSISAGGVPVTESAGACETYKQMTGVGDDALECSPGPNFDVCGAFEEERKIYFKGPDVVNNRDSYKAHYEACLRPQEGDLESMCVEPNRENGTRLVHEGSVRNITPYYEENDETYQKGGNSPDDSICLDIDNDVGGEWYNLDDWDATDYVRDNINDNGGSKTGALESNEWIDYWIDEHPQRENQSVIPDDVISPKIFEDPDHGTPGGFALEEDCHSSIDCSSAPESLTSAPYYGSSNYNTFNSSTEDDDFSHNDSFEVNLSNYHNRIVINGSAGVGAENNQSNQTWLNISDEPFNNSRINPENEQWALTPDVNDGVNLYGKPRIAGSCYGAPRVQGEHVNKTQRDVANSYLRGDMDVYAGGASNNSKDGNWVDPDNTSRSAILGGLSCDLTGINDTGYGFNTTGSNGEFTVHEGDIDKNEPLAVTGDIEFADESLGNASFNPPACGDDPGEHLIEEQGESSNSLNTSGRFACVKITEKCVSYANGDVNIYNQSNTTNAGELGEDYGRLKEDEEVCDTQKFPDNDTQGTWYDQDLRQEYCRENGKWRESGVQWFDESYINEHPLAVRGGIDDSWNNRTANQSHKHLVADPKGDHWSPSGNPLNQGFVPISSGTGDLYNETNSTYPSKSVVADVRPYEPTSEKYGFCGGDDETEYPIFQDSENSVVETDMDVRGVATDPDHCVLEPEQVNLEAHRKIYEEGELVETGKTNEVGENKVIGCFQGQWWNEWPIIFIDQDTSVTFGGDERASFYLINPTENPITYDLSLETSSSDLKDITSFEQNGENEVSFTLDPSTTQTHHLAINASNEGTSGTATVSVSSSSIEGEDDTEIAVTNEVAEGSGEIREVSGITILQVMLIILVSTAFFFYISRTREAQ